MDAYTEYGIDPIISLKSDQSKKEPRKEKNRRVFQELQTRQSRRLQEKELEVIITFVSFQIKKIVFLSSNLLNLI